MLCIHNFAGNNKLEGKITPQFLSVISGLVCEHRHKKISQKEPLFLLHNTQTYIATFLPREYPKGVTKRWAIINAVVRTPSQSAGARPHQHLDCNVPHNSIPNITWVDKAIKTKCLAQEHKHVGHSGASSVFNNVLNFQSEEILLADWSTITSLHDVK